jgi:hypothetical protein
VNPGIGFSVYLTINDSHLRELESLLLRIVKTKGNKQKGKFAKSEDLRRRFSKDIKHSWQLEIQELLGLIPKQTRAPRHTVDDGPVPSLAKYLSKATTLRARHKGVKLVPRVARNGTVRFNGKLYNSPSLAAAAAAACKRSTCNGWTFWRYERAPGDWVQLDALRK